MASINPGYLPVVTIDREVHHKVREYVTKGLKPPMSHTSWTVIRILTGNCQESHYKAFLEEAKKVNQEIINHGHVEISKWLSGLLRHKFPKSYNEFIGGTQWFSAEYLHYHGFHHFTYYDPKKFLCIILFNSKSRFEVTVKLDKRGTPILLLRATQGHSGPRGTFSPELTFMEKIEANNWHRHTPIVHGTTAKNWRSIEERGLVPQNHLYGYGRNAVHFLSVGMKIRESDRHPRLSSIRHTADLFIELNIEQWIIEGKPAYLAPNGVVCIFEPIPERFFLTVVKGRDHHPETHQGVIHEFFILHNRVYEVPLMSYMDRVVEDVTPPPSQTEAGASAPGAAQSSQAASASAEQPPQPAESASAAQEGEVSGTPMEVEEEVQPPTKEDLCRTLIRDCGPWTTDFINTMNLFQRKHIDPGEERYGFMWDYNKTYGDEAWQYPLSLLNVYYMDQKATWDEFNDCVPSMVLYDELAPYLHQALNSYHDPKIRDEDSWHQRLESGCGLRLWYITVRTAKTMVVHDFDVDKTLADLRLDRADIQLTRRFMRKEWFMKMATKLSGLIEIDINEGKFQREDLYTKNIWYSPLYIQLLELPMNDELEGEFGRSYPPSKAVENSWVPRVLEPILDAMQKAPLSQEFIPFQRPGKEVVNMRTRVTNFEKCEDMTTRVFHLEKEFLIWEKYQAENLKYVPQKVKKPLTLMDQPEAQEEKADEIDDGKIFDAMFQENRTSDPSGKPASSTEMDEPVEPTEGGVPSDLMPNPGPNMVEHDSAYFSFDILQKYRTSAKDPMIGNYPPTQTWSLVDYLKVVAYYDFKIQPGQFESGDSRTSGQTQKDYKDYLKNVAREDAAAPVAERVQALPGEIHQQPKATRPNTTTEQLSIFSLNLGNMLRKPKSRLAPSDLKKSENIEDSMLFNLLAKNSSHVICLCEADGLQGEKPKQFLADHHWDFVQSYDRNMAVGARMGKNMQIKILYDTTDPEYKQYQNYEDDPIKPGTPETILWYMIVEVKYGTEYCPGQVEPIGASARIVSRAGMETTRFLIFHTNHKAASTKAFNVRLRYRQMMTDIARYQVDVVTGDANASMYKAFNSQPTYSIADSSLHKMMLAMGRFINYHAGGWPNYLDIRLVSSNTTEQLDELKKFYQTVPHQRTGEAPSVDCIVLYFLSWGHSSKLRSFRDTFGFELNPNTGLYEGMDAEEYERQTTDIVMGNSLKRDYDLKVTNYYMQFDNDLMLLGASDHDWHTPLQTVIRYGRDSGTARKRSAAAEAKRAAGKRGRPSGTP